MHMDYADFLDPKMIFAALVSFVVFAVEEFIISIVEGVSTDMIIWSANYIEQSGYQYGALCASIIKLIPAAMTGVGAYAFCSSHSSP